MADSQRSLDMDKISQRIDYLHGLIGDEHIPTNFNEIKKLIEPITTFGTIYWKIQTLKQANPSSGAMDQINHNHIFVKVSKTFKDNNKPSFFHVQSNWTFQNLMGMIPLAGYIRKSSISS